LRPTRPRLFTNVILIPIILIPIILRAHVILSVAHVILSAAKDLSLRSRATEMKTPVSRPAKTVHRGDAAEDAVQADLVVMVHAKGSFAAIQARLVIVTISLLLEHLLYFVYDGFLPVFH
jgi:hypothetical protein